MTAARVAIACIAVVMPACGQKEPPKPSTVSTRLSSAHKLIVVTLPPHLRQLDAIPVSAKITSLDGRPLQKCIVTASLTMPDMPMPENTIPLTETTAGVYTGEGRFTMEGKWQITFSVRSGSDAAECFKMPLVTVE